MKMTEFSTSDLGLAAALDATGHRLVRIEPGDGKRAVFVFETSHNLTSAVEAFWSRCLAVDALTYCVSLKQLKNRLFAQL